MDASPPCGCSIADPQWPVRALHVGKARPALGGFLATPLLARDPCGSSELSKRPCKRKAPQKPPGQLLGRDTSEREAVRLKFSAVTAKL